MAAHNEETVLEEKLAGLSTQDYPGPMVFYVGSDCSTDRTNDILKDWAAKDERLSATFFTTRQGKPEIINQLAAAAGNDGVFVLTDASVMLRADTISALVNPMMNDQRIGVVDATMIQTGGNAAGIGLAEATYINREVAIKRAEGRLWGAMIGPFGGCWALRANAFAPVPGNFLVDDFYLCMAAYEAGWHGVSSAEAIVYEGVGQSIEDEFRRKVRISSGNWQNLMRFRQLWWPPFQSPLAFAFFSHKVLRWWTPFFVLTGTICVLLLLLTLGNHWATPLFALLLGFVPALAAADFALASLGVHLRVLRGLRYFLAMNAALLVGFFRYLTGIKSNVWQPTQRH
jgi:cellulose synthase/poly-beta-1,6-N-acetylglucosamine synthase-like glycosyltransferase